MVNADHVDAPGIPKYVLEANHSQLARTMKPTVEIAALAATPTPRRRKSIVATCEYTTTAIIGQKNDQPTKSREKLTMAAVVTATSASSARGRCGAGAFVDVSVIGATVRAAPTNRVRPARR